MEWRIPCDLRDLEQSPFPNDVDERLSSNQRQWHCYQPRPVPMPDVIMLQTDNAHDGFEWEISGDVNHWGELQSAMMLQM